MNRRYARIAAAISGVALLTVALLPLVAPEAVTAARAYVIRDNTKTEPEAQQDSIPIPVMLTETTSGTTEAVQPLEEAVVVKADGHTEKVAVVAAVAEAIRVAVANTQELQTLEEQVQKQEKPWLLDPVLVVRTTAAQFGFNDTTDTFTLLSVDKATGNAKVLVEHDGRYYLVSLSQPAGSGAGRIWQVVSIQQVKAVVKTTPEKSRIDVGPGVEGLDYSKVVKWQQNVDGGRELWRLNAVEVARREGKDYGFDENDTYTIIRQYSSTNLSRHGQIDFEVKHDGKVYTMIVVKPFGGGDAIWTVYKVSTPRKPAQPAPQPAEKVLYSNDRYGAWKWHDKQYFRDMDFAVVTDQSQLNVKERLYNQLPEIDYTKKVAFAVYLGRANGGGYDIGIESITQLGNQITVKVHTRSPGPDEITTKNITFPADYVVLDRQTVDMWGGVTVTFVDQKGVNLAQERVVIKH